MSDKICEVLDFDIRVPLVVSKSNDQFPFSFSVITRSKTFNLKQIYIKLTNKYTSTFKTIIITNTCNYYKYIMFSYSITMPVTVNTNLTNIFYKKKKNIFYFFSTFYFSPFKTLINKVVQYQPVVRQYLRWSDCRSHSPVASTAVATDD